MALTLNITTETNQDFDGINETVKQVTVDISGKRIKELYSYPSATADATIQSEVETDLTAKGYTW